MFWPRRLLADAPGRLLNIATGGLASTGTDVLRLAALALLLMLSGVATLMGTRRGLQEA
jgi:hypothetical protein